MQHLSTFRFAVPTAAGNPAGQGTNVCGTSWGKVIKW
jgi:hypothetical protein